MSIDILKGIGIILVLVAHSLGGYVHTFAYSFHMPLFFIVAGYFCKAKPIIPTMRNDFKRLFIPFFFTASVMFIASLLLCKLNIDEIKSPQYTLEALLYGNGSSVNQHKVWGNWSVVGSVWFLPALFWAKTAFNIMLNKLSTKCVALLSLVIGGLAAFVGQEILLPYSLLQGMTALPFLLIGYMVKQRGGVRACKEGVLSNKKILCCMMVLTICWIISTFFNSLDMAQFNWKLYYYPNVVLAATGTFICWLVSDFISTKTRYIANCLSFFGIYSIILVCFPVIETYIIPLKVIIPSIPMKGLVVLSCKVLWCVLTMFLTFKIKILRKIFSIK